MRLGRTKHDPALLVGAPAHRMAAAAPPPSSLDRSSIVWTPTLVQNNVLPTCTTAALINAARAFALRHGFDIPVDEVLALAFYARVAGCADTIAAIEATDGLDMVTVVRTAQATGVDVGGQTPLVPSFATIEIGDRHALADAMTNRDAANIGVDLALADQAMDVWDTVTPANAGDPTPGSWGGHDMVAVDYTGLDDTDTVRFATWGGWKLGTWRWLHSRLEVAFSHQWGALGAAP